MTILCIQFQEEKHNLYEIHLGHYASNITACKFKDFREFFEGR